MQSKNLTMMNGWLMELDRILRGEATKPVDIRRADIQIPVFGVGFIVMMLAVLYGLCMGGFALVRGFEGEALSDGYMQAFATMCKVPLLFAMTLIITFPSLYVFNALVGSQLKFVPVLKLLVASLAVNLSVLASLGPIVAFFSFSTPNYGFIVLLNVVVFSISGILGLAFLVQTLKRLTAAHRGGLPVSAIKPTPGVSSASSEAPPSDPVLAERIRGSAEIILADPVESPGADQPGPLEEVQGLVVGRHIWKVFSVWICVFGLVGAQMGWVLRPFIGNPNMPFTWFRARHSNFFEAVGNQLWNLLLG